MNERIASARNQTEVKAEEDYQFNVAALREALVEAAKKYPLLSGLVYTSPHDFVAQHGIDYRPVRWRWGKEGVGVQKKCYGNAIMLSGKYDVKYVEGFALSPHGEVIAHGWNAFTGGELLDSTWANTGLAYIGVEFSLERGDDATWNGDACVLNDENRNYPVLQQRWKGEDYSLIWPKSDRIDAMFAYRTTGIYTPPASVVEWEMSRK